MQPAMLVVTSPFGKYAKGDEITDDAAVVAVMATNYHDVICVHFAKPADPAPEAAHQTEGEGH